MWFQSFLTSLCIFAGASMSANFTAYDTTVQVKIWSNGLSDSTFIKLRNTGFSLSFTATSSDASCPIKDVQGDFEVRPNSSWDVQGTNSFGDSAVFAQTMVSYYCDLGMYFRRVLTPNYKYQQHWWYKGTLSDTIYTRVKTVVNDSTFVLTVSAQNFALTTAIKSNRHDLIKPISMNGYMLNGRKSDTPFNFIIDAQGRKSINLKSSKSPNRSDK